MRHDGTCLAAWPFPRFLCVLVVLKGQKWRVFYQNFFITPLTPSEQAAPFEKKSKKPQNVDISLFKANSEFSRQIELFCEKWFQNFFCTFFADFWVLCRIFNFYKVQGIFFALSTSIAASNISVCSGLIILIYIYLKITLDGDEWCAYTKIHFINLHKSTSSNFIFWSTNQQSWVSGPTSTIVSGPQRFFKNF